MVCQYPLQPSVFVDTIRDPGSSNHTVALLHTRFYSRRWALSHALSLSNLAISHDYHSDLFPTATLLPPSFARKPRRRPPAADITCLRVGIPSEFPEPFHNPPPRLVRRLLVGPLFFSFARRRDGGPTPLLGRCVASVDSVRRLARLWTRTRRDDAAACPSGPHPKGRALTLGAPSSTSWWVIWGRPSPVPLVIRPCRRRVVGHHHSYICCPRCFYSLLLLPASFVRTSQLTPPLRPPLHPLRPLAPTTSPGLRYQTRTLAVTRRDDTAITPTQQSRIYGRVPQTLFFAIGRQVKKQLVRSPPPVDSTTRPIATSAHLTLTIRAATALAT